jgi:hypothetical protein
MANEIFVCVRKKIVTSCNALLGESGLRMKDYKIKKPFKNNG